MNLECRPSDYVGGGRAGEVDSVAIDNDNDFCGRGTNHLKNDGLLGNDGEDDHNTMPVKVFACYTFSSLNTVNASPSNSTSGLTESSAIWTDSTAIPGGITSTQTDSTFGLRVAPIDMPNVINSGPTSPSKNRVDEPVPESVPTAKVSTLKSFASLVTNEAITSQRVAFPVVEYYVKNAWKKFDLVREGDELGSNEGSSKTSKKVVQDVASSTSGSLSNTHFVSRINDLESQMTKEKFVLPDDDGKPLKASKSMLSSSSNVVSKKVDDMVNEDKDSEVEEESHGEDPYDDVDFEDPGLSDAQMKFADTFNINLSQPDFRYHIYGENGNYTRNSTYQRTLDTTLSTLPNTNNGFGFFNFSAGESSSAERVYSVALCQGDLEPDVCRGCINDSIIKLPQLCPNQKEAVGYYG
nr:putative gnk2-like domain-containing protein [Tanacetum cinerariifolium]